MNNREKTRKAPAPLRLLRNVRYPTYQLKAVAGIGQKNPEHVLTLMILETLQWLRLRFRDFDMPQELCWPKACDAEQVSFESFESFHLDEGYQVEVIVLHEEKIWTMQLVEPDLGSNPGEEQQARKPVPGRLFETNIAYRMENEAIACGFQTMVCEPQGTKASCEVYRLAVIKRLVENPNIGLWHTYPLNRLPIAVDTSANVRDLCKHIRDPERFLPIVVLVQKTVSDTMPFDDCAWPMDESWIKTAMKPPVLREESLSKRNNSVETVSFSVDPDRVCRHKMGYAQIFTLHHERIASFAKAMNLKVEPGDLLLIEPKAFGLVHTRYGVEQLESQADSIPDCLHQKIQNYPAHKEMTFGRAVFLEQAKEMERGHMTALGQSKEEMMDRFEQDRKDLIKRHSMRDQERLQQMEAKDQKLLAMQDQMNDLEQKLREQQSILDQKQQMIDSQGDKIRFWKERIKWLQSRPNKPSKVADWAQDCFSDRLVFHKQAMDKMSRIDAQETDVGLICDALEYLALDYLDFRQGRIDENTLRGLCEEKYDRPFSVTPLTGGSVEAYPSEYTVSYKTLSGRWEDRTLDLHLGVGNKAERLLRIYFFYDKQRKRLVIGSLPKHLPTVGYR